MRPVDHDPNNNNGAGRTQGTIIGPLVFGRNDSRRRASAVLRPSEAPHHQQQQGGGGKQHSLTPTTRSSFVSSTATGREDHLADDVVEVHDVCLLVTQRYLNALRINWQLRHGREEAVVPGSAAAAAAAGVVMAQRLAFGRTPRKTRRRGGLAGDGGGGHHRKARKQRRGGQRRALREDSYYLAASESSSRGEDDDGTGMDSDRRPRRHCPPQDNNNNDNNNSRRSPIPRPTDSLLQNIHSICDLIWRRARRDRADVLGAEVQGCRAMQVLQESGETIVLHDAGAFSRDPGGCFARVLGAGRAICRELGDWEALRVMESWEEEEQEAAAAAAAEEQQPGVLI